MEAQYFSISVDDLKRMYPNLNLESLHLVSVGSGVSEESLNSQQVIITPDESLVLNEAPIQQLVTYQPRTQTTQPTHYIIQQADDDNNQSTAVAQQQICYSAEVPRDQRQQNQQQLLGLTQIQAGAQQNFMIQKTLNTNQQQTSLLQQPIRNQNTTQHVIVQPTTQHIVLQQQTPQQQQQNSNPVVMRQIPTGTINQPRYVYSQHARAVVYNAQHQQTESQQNRVVQQPQTRHVILTGHGQQQIQANLIYQTQQSTQQQSAQQQSVQQQPAQQQSVQQQPVQQQPMQQQPAQQPTPLQQPSQQQTAQQQTAQQQQQSVQQQSQQQPTQQTTTTIQQKVVVDTTGTQPVSPSRIIRTPTYARSLLQQAPKLNPFRGNIRLTTPSIPSALAQTTSDKITPSQITTLVKTARRTSYTPRGRGNGRGRGRGTATNSRSLTKKAELQLQQLQQQPPIQQQMRPPVPPLVPTPPTSISHRIFPVNTVNTTPKNQLSAQLPQRMVALQGQRTPSPNVSTVTGCPTQLTTKYRIPKLNTTSTFNLDLEESIQAVVVTKASDQVTTINTPSTDSKPFQTTLTTYSAIECSDDDKKSMKMFNGRVMPLSEFKRQQARQHQLQQQSLQSTNKPGMINRTATITNRLTAAQPLLAITKTPNQSPSICDDKKMTRPQPQGQHIIQPITGNRLQNQDGDTQKSARMLVILSSGEQRLITFTLPRESCTVQELLEQVGVPFTAKTSIQCVPNPGANIDYVVTVGITVEESANELISAVENTLQLTKQEESNQQAQIIATPDQTVPSLQAIKTAPEKSTEIIKEIPGKIIPGYLAVCTFCGYTGGDFSKCERCRRIFIEEPKRVLSSSSSGKAALKEDEEKKRQPLQAELLSRAATKAAFTVSAPATIPSVRGGKVTISTSTRGRGRGASRMKAADIEPVILTLSSDDEADDDKSNKSMKTAPAAPSPNFQKPLPCEPIIDDTIQMPQNIVREDVADVANSIDQLYTSITCRTIRFGTYRYEPKEKVFFSSKGVKIVAPNCQNHLDIVVLNIQMREIVKIIAHFSKALTVMFIYTLPTCGIYIRENLEMKTKSAETPYYNPSDRAEPYKRIVLQMDVISEESKSVIRSIFTQSILEEVQCTEASELLIRSCSKDKTVKLDPNVTVKIETDIRQILIYPPGKGGIPINTEDYMCLAVDQYLNDVIIDFYLKHLHTYVLTEEQKKKTHIFSTFFYNRLTTMSTRQRQSDKDVKLTASQKRHARVKSWTKNVNLFEKDFIIIPINEQSHWFLAIICFPRLQGPVTFETHEPVINRPAPKKKKIAVERKSLQIGSTTITPLSKREMDSVCVGDDSLSERDEAEGDESDLASDESEVETNGNSITNNDPSIIHLPIKQPLILIFDSLSGASRSRVVATLRDYLTCEYKAKIKEDSAHAFNKLNMPGHCVKVPQQNNFTDCGLYLLQYVEQFFIEPIVDYKLPIKQLVNWFETIVVTRKREEISNLLRNLVEIHNPDRLPLPEIVFPTLNGKLVEPELTDEQAEFEEEEMEEEAEEEEEEEIDSIAGGDTEGELSPEKQRNGEKSIVTPILTLKRSIDQAGKQQEPIFRKTARLNESE